MDISACYFPCELHNIALAIRPGSFEVRSRRSSVGDFLSFFFFFAETKHPGNIIRLQQTHRSYQMQQCSPKCCPSWPINNLQANEDETVARWLPLAKNACIMPSDQEQIRGVAVMRNWGNDIFFNILDFNATWLVLWKTLSMNTLGCLYASPTQLQSVFCFYSYSLAPVVPVDLSAIQNIGPFETIWILVFDNPAGNFKTQNVVY